ncbi:MAG: S8/S53 family peptidase, partial [Bdellovibrionales bacterium]|nr:S8/S53 family peptidase [Bdellovibrionales bacterium]
MLIFISFSVQANELSINKKEKFESYQEIKKNNEKQYFKMLKELQKVLILKDEGSKSQVLNFLSKLNVKIVATGSTFIIIRPLENIDKNDFNKILDKIKNRDEIKSITSDSIVRKKEESDDITKVCNKDNQKQVSDLLKPLFQITQEASQSKCYMAPHCNDNINPSWARMQIGADLAEKVVAKTLKDNENELLATVAVIDSGFDFKNQSNAIDANSIVIEKGHESSGNPNIDPDGHGTAVSGMVSGNGIGITKNINLRVYRVTEKYATGSTSSAMLAASIEKACEKSDIVNVSWGSAFDELGMSKIENALWYKKAKERGCLVVKSAGNSGVKNAKKQEIPIDAPFISVAASDQFSEEATFSTKGMISAPGAGVYSLLSHHHEYSNSTIKNGCRLNGAAVGPINGTSFSSPILAGVAGQVLTILKSNKAMPADPVKKVSLLKSILLASVKWNRETGSKNNSVNALLATLIATKMTNNNYTLELDKLTDLGKQAAANKCEEQVNDCDNEILCENKRTCSDSLRYKIFACVPLSEQVFKYAISSFNSMNEIELIQSLFQRVPANNTLKNKLLTALENSWALYIKKGSSINLEKSITVLDKARQKGFKEFITLKKFKQIIYSYSFSDAFNINELIGKNIWNGGNESLFPKFILAFKELTIKEQKK